jgi:hypothetical protein
MPLREVLIYVSAAKLVISFIFFIVEERFVVINLEKGVFAGLFVEIVAVSFEVSVVGGCDVDEGQEGHCRQREVDVEAHIHSNRSSQR